MNYNEGNSESIYEYARRLLDKSLSDVIETEKSRFNNNSSKGRLGQIVEENYFGYKVNSRQEADFKKAGLELKVCPLKQIKPKKSSNNIREQKGYSAKERMVLSIIDYFKLSEEKWEHNSLMKKCKNLLLMFYMNEYGVEKTNLIFRIIDIWNPSEQDMKIIENDWRLIQSKVLAGKAEEISEGDTMYLGACTKGSTAEKSKRGQPFSDKVAPQRAFCYKRNYVDSIINELLEGENKKKNKISRLSTEESLYDNRLMELFGKLIGKSIYEINKIYSISRERKAKNYIRLVVDDICKLEFGDKLDNFEEFKKAGIEIKTIVLKPNGMPKESMSFEQINFCEIIKENWEESTIRSKFENKKHLWIIFKSRVDFEAQSEVNLNDLILEKVMFWNMPISDLDGSMHRVWEDTVLKIKQNKYDEFIKISDGEIAHIRPKAKNNKDLMITPQGTMEKRKCFWLNAKYIKKQIELIN